MSAGKAAGVLLEIAKQESIQSVLQPGASAVLANTSGGLESGLVNWEEVADARGQVRSVSFADEQGVENEVWMDYNADILAWEEVPTPSTLTISRSHPAATAQPQPGCGIFYRGPRRVISEGR